MEDIIVDAVSEVTDAEENLIPTRQEYESAVYKLYKSFYDEDIAKIKKEAEAIALDMAYKEISEKEEAIRQAAERALLEKIKNKRQRISEIGIMKNTGNIRRSVSDMTKEERAIVAKRAARGEIINLK